jgi:restriction system protein
MKVLDAVFEVLNAAGEPLHSDDIARRAISGGLWQTDGATPHATVNARLATDIQKNGTASRFQRTGKGYFALRSWGLEEHLTKRAKESGVKVAHKQRERVAGSRQVLAEPTVSVASGPGRDDEPERQSMSFTDATEFVLRKYGAGRPMHYRSITEKALELGLLRTKGQTPEATLYSQVIMETERRKKRGETGRFVRHKKGLISLATDERQGLTSEIQRHNTAMRRQLLQRLKAMSPVEFERLIGDLLTKLGFDQVDVTRSSGDGGIDVRGTLVVGDVIRTKMAVQVKRWKQNVLAPVVQQVRGSLGAHEQGLIITTSDFSSGARAEAERGDTTPVGLMNGEQLVGLLVEHQLGIVRNDFHLLELSAQDEQID